jgi:hypothetical protein
MGTIDTYHLASSSGSEERNIMSIEITATPPTGEVIATVSAVRFDITGANDNDPTTFDEDNVPTEDPIPFRLVASKAGWDDLISHEFNVSADGEHTWDNVIFPDDGAWTVDLIDQRDDSTAATLAVTVTT